MTLNFTNFTSFDELQLTKSDEPIIISIIDDMYAEPSESLICSILAGVVESVRTVDPKQVTIVIRDDEGKKDVYEAVLHARGSSMYFTYYE